MKVLYVVGKGSRHDNIELRWSLRSLAKYAANVTGVVVAGYPPDWLSDEVVKIHVPDDPKAGYKHVNIMNAILAAIDAKAVEGEFLYSSDDHFLCGPCDFDRYPVLRRAGCLPPAGQLKSPGDRHVRSLVFTGMLCRACGLSTQSWWTHANTHMDTRDADAVRGYLAHGRRLKLDSLGFEPTCLFMAARLKREPKLRSIPRFGGDIKLGDEFRLPGPGCVPFISISDKAFRNERFVKFMVDEFGEPCRYEATSGPAGRAAPPRNP